MSAGIAMGAIVSVQSPPLIDYQHGDVGLRRDHAVAMPARSICGRDRCRWSLVAYSIAGARSFIAARPQAAQPRRGSAQGAATSSTSSKTAAAAGSGRPIAKAPCPMCRSSSPTISSCEPPELLGRQFTDLLSVDTSPGDDNRRAQDARLPPVGAFPVLGRGRPASERRGHPLVAVRQSDLRRARTLPRLPRHRHRPHRAAPFRAGNLAARALRFADRPAQPGDDAPDAGRGAAQCVEPAEGLRAVPDRSRPLQERQRHARPPGRRRACSARSPSG